MNIAGRSKTTCIRHISQRALFSSTRIVQEGGKTNTVLVRVPQESAYIVERLGKYNRTLQPGLSFLIPVIDKVPYFKTLKEVATPVEAQSATTEDNVPLEIDGVMYTKIHDAHRASYGVENLEYAMQELAQTTMRAEVAKLTFQEVLQARRLLSNKIVDVVNQASKEAWGTTCVRYEIRDVVPPKSVTLAMQRAAMEKLFPES